MSRNKFGHSHSKTSKAQCGLLLFKRCQVSKRLLLLNHRSMYIPYLSRSFWIIESRHPLNSLLNLNCSLLMNCKQLFSGTCKINTMCAIQITSIILDRPRNNFSPSFKNMIKIFFYCLIFLFKQLIKYDLNQNLLINLFNIVLYQRTIYFFE